MTRVQRILHHSISTWPRQLVWLILAGKALGWLLDDVLNGAEWVVLVSLAALGFTLSYAVPSPEEIRKRLAATLAERNTP